MHPNHRSRLHFPALFTVILGLSACGDPEPPALGDAPTEDGEVRLREPCVMSHVYLVEDDELTYDCGNEWEVDRQWRGEFQTGRCVRPANVLAGEPYYSTLLALHYRRGGRAELWWGDAPAIVTEIDRSYFTQKKTDIRVYENANGDRAELHVLSRSACFTPPPGPLTRAEVETLEH